MRSRTGRSPARNRMRRAMSASDLAVHHTPPAHEPDGERRGRAPARVLAGGHEGRGRTTSPPPIRTDLEPMRLHEQLRRLSPEQLAQQSPETINNIPPETFGNLSLDQFRALRHEQVQAISEGQAARLSGATLNTLSPGQLAQLSPQAFANIPPQAFNTLADDKINAITAAQLEAVANRLRPGTPVADITALSRLADNTNRGSLFKLLRKIGARSTIVEINQLVTRAKHHDNTRTFAQIETLVAALPDGGNPAASLLPLIDSIGNRSSLDETRALIEQALHHDPTTNLNQINDLVGAAPTGGNSAAGLRTLIDSIGNRSTITETQNLLNRAKAIHPTMTLNQVDALVNAVPATAIPAGESLANSLRDLINDIRNASTIDETRQLIERAIHHNANTTLPEIRTLVQRAGIYPNVATDLRDLVNAVQNHARIPDIATMVQRARAQFDIGQTNALIPLINHGPNQNTPARVIALLDAIHVDPRRATPVARLNRFNRIVNLIPLFEGRAGRPGGPDAQAVPRLRRREDLGRGIFASQVSYDTMYMRHSYRHFDFAHLNNSNSMWTDGTNIRNLLINEFPARAYAL